MAADMSNPTLQRLEACLTQTTEYDLSNAPWDQWLAMQNTVEIADGTSHVSYSRLANLVFDTTSNANPFKVVVKTLRFAAAPAEVKQHEQKIHKRIMKASLVWQTLKHRNIRPFLAVLKPEEANPMQPRLLYLIADTNRTLDEYFESQNVSLHHKLEIFQGVANGLKYLHSYNIPHGDIQPANIMHTESGPCLVDIGLNMQIVDLTRTFMNDDSVPVQAYYSAPEVLLGKIASLNSDIWSLGMTIINIVTGEIPFLYAWNIFPPQLSDTFPLNEEEVRKPNEGLESYLWSIWQSCWQREPDKRPRIESIVLQLYSDWAPEYTLQPRSVERQRSFDKENREIMHFANLLKRLESHSFCYLEASDDKLDLCRSQLKRLQNDTRRSRSFENDPTISTILITDILERLDKGYCQVQSDESNHDPLTAACYVKEPFARGSFATVHIGHATSLEASERKIYAVKVPNILNLEHNMKELDKEINIWKAISMKEHPNIARLLAVWHSSAGTRCLVSELSPFINEKSMMQRADYFVLKHRSSFPRVIQGITDGLAFMHCMNCCHRDLKPSNVIMFGNEADPVARLTDFGYSKMYPRLATQHALTERVGGSDWYCSPQLLRLKRRKKAKINLAPPPPKATDVWAYAITVLELASSKRPYVDQEQIWGVMDILEEAIVTDIWMPDYCLCIPPCMRSTIVQCLKFNSDSRPTMQTIKARRDQLSHEDIAAEWEQTLDETEQVEYLSDAYLDKVDIWRKDVEQGYIAKPRDPDERPYIDVK